MKAVTLILATASAAIFAVVCAANLTPVVREAAHETVMQGAVLAFYYLLVPALLLALATVLPIRLLRKGRRAWALASAAVLFCLAAPMGLFELFLAYG